MAVQKHKVTRRRRGNRRGGALKSTPPVLATDKHTGEVHLRHHVTARGYYRGKKVVLTANPDSQLSDNNA